MKVRHSILPLTLALVGLALAPVVRGQSTITFTTLYNFSALTGDYPGHNADGAFALEGLVQGRDGNFYGTAADGGANSSGTVYKLTAAGAFTTLHTFSALSSTDINRDGARPAARLVEGPDSNFYGTTSDGGAHAAGTVFRITPAGAVTTLHTFDPDSGDGSSPRGNLLLASDGSFYGTASYGGSHKGGTVFKIKSTGALTTLWNFPEGEGTPDGSLVEGKDGDFYGTTAVSGAGFDGGTVFKLTPAGQLTTLHSFTYGSKTDGNAAYGGLVQGNDGNFYGVTEYGGTYDEGTVYRITPAGAFTLLYSFPRRRQPRT